MATQTLPPHPSYVLLTLAQREARLAVKEQLRACGIKVQHMRASEISATAKLYFEANARTLLEEAWRKCQRCPDLMRFHEKAEKDRARTNQLAHGLFGPDAFDGCQAWHILNALSI
jgi:hypothetical protein